MRGRQEEQIWCCRVPNYNAIFHLTYSMEGGSHLCLTTCIISGLTCAGGYKQGTETHTNLTCIVWELIVQVRINGEQKQTQSLTCMVLELTCASTYKWGTEMDTSLTCIVWELTCAGRYKQGTETHTKSHPQPQCTLCLPRLSAAETLTLQLVNSH